LLYLLAELVSDILGLSFIIGHHSLLVVLMVAVLTFKMCNRCISIGNLLTKITKILLQFMNGLLVLLEL